MTYDLSGRNAIVTGASQGLGLAIARAYVEAGASVAICAREESSLKAAVEQLRAVARGSQKVVAAPSECRCRDGGRRVRRSRAARARAHRHSREQRRRLRPDRADRRRRLGGLGRRRSRSTCSGRCSSAARCCRTSKRTGAARSFSSPAAARPIRCRGSAPTRRRRRRSSASPRRSPRRCARAASTSTRIAPGALNTRLLDEVLAAGPERVGEAFLRAVAETEGDGRRAAEKRRGPRRLSRIGRQRRHHRQAAQRGLGSVGGAAAAPATTCARPTSTRCAASSRRTAA